jgi:hypothetical protein
MKRITPIAKHLLFAAATVAALGFGAAQAFAAPRGEAQARACYTWVCPECGSFGGQWISGRCYCCG